MVKLVKSFRIEGLRKYHIERRIRTLLVEAE